MYDNYRQIFKRLLKSYYDNTFEEEVEEYFHPIVWIEKAY